MWCVAELDEAYIEKMEDVLAVYEKPYDPTESVVCVDEKPVSLHADVRPPIPAKPGKPAKQDNEYERRGTANVFGAVEPKAGRHFTTATPDRSGYQFACLVKRIVEHYPQAHTIHLVMDNLNIHCLAELGLVALRFDYRSTGDSFDRVPGVLDESGFSTDLQLAVQFVKTTGPGPVSLVGMRLGANFASVLCRSEPVDALVLWDPCVT